MTRPLLYHRAPDQAGIYIHALYAFARHEIDWLADDIKVMLCTSGYVPDLERHRFVDQVTNEVVSRNYEPQSLQCKTVVRRNGMIYMDCSDAVWGWVTFHATRAVIFKDAGLRSNSPLIGACLFPDAPRVIRGTYTVTWDTNGAAIIPDYDMPTVELVK